MSSWAISWERRALDEARKLDPQHRRRIVEAVESLAQDPFAKGIPLTGEWKGLRRMRAGSFRIIYAAEQGMLRVLIVRVGHRKDVYRHG
ncbi:MAG: type II toxin-antitoxin system RelE/ParE family toxin [bacterium]